MEIHATFVTEAIPRPMDFRFAGNDGALAEFYGIIRQEEAGARIAGLKYAIYAGVLSRHRQEAFGLLAAFMDRLKKDVPIWKVGAVSC